jgi:hypothetical protein
MATCEDSFYDTLLESVHDFVPLNEGRKRTNIFMSKFLIFVFFFFLIIIIIIIQN